MLHDYTYYNTAGRKNQGILRKKYVFFQKIYVFRIISVFFLPEADTCTKNRFTPRWVQTGFFEALRLISCAFVLIRMCQINQVLCPNDNSQSICDDFQYSEVTCNVFFIRNHIPFSADSCSVSGFLRLVDRTKQVHLFFYLCHDCFVARQEQLSRVKALALQILAFFDVLSGSFCEYQLALSVYVDLCNAPERLPL